MIANIYSLLFKKEKKFFLTLVIVIFFTSLLEVLGLFSVMPFIAIIADQNIIDDNKLLSKIYNLTDNLFAFQNVNSFIILLGIISICGIFLSMFFRLTNNFLISKFMCMGTVLSAIWLPVGEL